MRRLVLIVPLALAACTVPGPYSDPQGVQLPLFGSRDCSDPVFDQMAMQCCSEHDVAFAAGGTYQDFRLANAEFEVCMLLWGVPPDVAYARRRAVDIWGWESWHETEHRTRGPAR